MPNTPKPKALEAFRKACQEYVVCYGIACDGMPSFRGFIEQLMNRHSVDRAAPYGVGTGTPVLGLYPAKLSLGEVLDKSDNNGEFSNQIAKMTIVATYSLWEDYYRDQIAEELQLEKKGKKARKNRISSELMGDIRHIRICIVHKNSIVSDEQSHFTVIDHHQFPEGPLRLTRTLMAEIMQSINDMAIRVD